jgi:outer membrane lipoprotein SlyB
MTATSRQRPFPTDGDATMKTFLWAMITAIIGGVLGAFLALGFGTSLGAASGLIQGSQIGICLAVETAHEQGRLDDEGADELIAAALAQVKAKVRGLPGGEIDWVADRAGCAELTARLAERPVGLAAPAQ